MCENYLILIDDLLEGELDAETAQLVSKHICVCRSCETEFEMLKSEKKMYSQYLFEIEPPQKIREEFQTKLAYENRKTLAFIGTSANCPDWKTRFFGHLGFYPAFAFSSLIFLFGTGFIWLNYSENKKNSTNETISKAVNPAIFPYEISVPENSSKTEQAIAVKTDKQQEPVSLVKVKAVEIKEKPIVPKALPSEKKKSSETEKTNVRESIRLSDEDKMQINRIQRLQIETAKQLEKVELLLRSFRNARFPEGDQMFDIEYEKQYARKLLENNIRLRRKAESYGTFFAEEMLSKIEPYLLDISNLNANPTEEEVLEIKQRVKNQNIIVSLQGF